MSSNARRTATAAVGLALMIAVPLAIKLKSTPEQTKAQNPPPEPTVSIVFVIDSSKSMFPWSGPNYFDLAKEGIARFLQRFQSPDGSYEVSAIQLTRMGSRGYRQWTPTSIFAHHWFGPERLGGTDGLTVDEVRGLVQDIQRSTHYTNGLLDLGIREATEILGQSAASTKHLIILSTGEYRLPRPCPPPNYVHGTSASVCDSYTGTGCVHECNQLTDPSYNCFCFLTASSETEVCNRASHIRYFAEQASQTGSGIKISTIRVGEDWHNQDPLAWTRNEANQFGQECIEDPTETLSDVRCTSDYPPASPCQPSREQLLEEIADTSDVYKRINPIVPFNLEPDSHPGTAVDTANAIGEIFCASGGGGPNTDGDLLADLCNNCPSVNNQGQRDCDMDGIGDACQMTVEDCVWPDGTADNGDTDHDGVCNPRDICDGGDDCLVNLWRSKNWCWDTGETGCDCDCNHNGEDDACESAREIELQTLPIADNDTNPVNGIPDCCDDASCDCDPIPLVCDVDASNEFEETFESFTVDEAPFSEGTAQSAGWYLSETSAAADITVTNDGAVQSLELGRSASTPGAYFVKSPGLTILDFTCQEDANCEGEVDLGAWGVSKVEIDLLIDNDSKGSRFDLYITDPCRDDPEEGKRVHLRFDDEPTPTDWGWIKVADEFQGCNPPLCDLLGGSEEGGYHCAGCNFQLGSCEYGFKCLGHYPQGVRFTVTLIFNRNEVFDYTANKCVPSFDPSVEVYFSGGPHNFNWEQIVDNRFFETGSTGQLFDMRGLQVALVHSNTECACYYDLTSSEEDWNWQLVPTDCSDSNCLTCADTNDTAWMHWVDEYCIPNINPNKPDEPPCRSGQCPVGKCQDVCPGTIDGWQWDRDGDGWGDACSIFGNGADEDEDGLYGELDNCPRNPHILPHGFETKNPMVPLTLSMNSVYSDDSTGSKGNCAIYMLGLGDGELWQPDWDCDGIGNVCDNCPAMYNPNQRDSDHVQWDSGLIEKRYIGDACSEETEEELLEAGWNSNMEQCHSLSGSCRCTEGNDDDNDGYNEALGDNCDNCPFVQNDQRDTDGDGMGDACDVCPFVESTSQIDLDNDGVGDLCDNCPDKWNPDQVDNNRDGTGDLCDTTRSDDADGDGTPGHSDPCPYDNEDSCGNDFDSDGKADDVDNCGTVQNNGQEDRDCDGLGDACDDRTVLTDTDGDGVVDGCDNCRFTYNPNSTYQMGQSNEECAGLGAGALWQPDWDCDGVGDACDNCCQKANSGQEDGDQDGIGDHCDPDPDDAANQEVVASDDWACPSCVGPGIDDYVGCFGNGVSFPTGIDDSCEPDCDTDDLPDICDPCPCSADNTLYGVNGDECRPECPGLGGFCSCGTDELGDCLQCPSACDFCTPRTCICPYCQDKRNPPFHLDPPFDVVVVGRPNDEFPNGLDVDPGDICKDRIRIGRVKFESSTVCEWKDGMACDDCKCSGGNWTCND